MKRVLAVLVVFLLVASVPAAHASDFYTTGDASRLVASLATRANIINYEPGLTVSLRRERLLTMMENRIAFTDMGRFAVGRHWQQATIREQLELERLFRTVLPVVSFDRLTRYLDHNLRIDGTIRMASAGQEHDITLVRSVWNGGANPVRVDWRVEPRDSGLKVTDVFVNGFSMANTWRDYLARSGQNQGPRGIIGRLPVCRQHMHQTFIPLATPAVLSPAWRLGLTSSTMNPALPSVCVENACSP